MDPEKESCGISFTPKEKNYCFDEITLSIVVGLNFLNISLGSLGESVSGLYSYRKAKQISEEQFEKLDSQAYKLENGLLKLVESLERKRDRGDWIDHLVVKGSNAVYGND